MATSQLVTVARIEEIPPGSVLHLRVGDHEVALANVAGQISALDGTCPHLGGPLGHGALEGCVLSCPWHGWQFDVTTGANEFDRSIGVATYHTVVENGEVKIALP